MIGTSENTSKPLCNMKHTVPAHCYWGLRPRTSCTGLKAGLITLLCYDSSGGVFPKCLFMNYLSTHSPCRQPSNLASSASSTDHAPSQHVMEMNFPFCTFIKFVKFRLLARETSLHGLAQSHASSVGQSHIHSHSMSLWAKLLDDGCLLNEVSECWCLYTGVRGCMTRCEDMQYRMGDERRGRWM